MKISIFKYFVIAGIASSISCKGPKESAEAPPVAKVEAAPESKQADVAPSPAATVGNQEREEKLGNDIVAQSVSRLNRKLVLNQQVSEKVSAILKNSFISIGGDINKTYPAAEARDLGMKIMKNSEVSISALLDEKQKETFKQLLSR